MMKELSSDALYFIASRIIFLVKCVIIEVDFKQIIGTNSII